MVWVETILILLPGVKIINISGKLDGFRFNNGGDRNKLINITSWGGLKFG